MSDQAKARKAVLWRARNRAMQILAVRHPEEFVQIKNDLLARWGHAPINSKAAVRRSTLADDQQ